MPQISPQEWQSVISEGNHNVTKILNNYNGAGEDQIVVQLWQESSTNTTTRLNHNQ